MSIQKKDQLHVSTNPGVEALLTKMGDNLPSPEIIYFSDFVVKINRRGKPQNRVVIITNKAVYNCISNNWGKCKRRIPIEKISAITASQVSDEFILHIPDEYDYRYKSSNRDTLISMIESLRKNRGPKKLKTTYLNQSTLKDQTFTKAMARLRDREKDLIRRNSEAEAHESDKEEEGDPRDVYTQMLQNTEKVKLDDFDLLKVIGRGSFGKVMLVRRKKTGKCYAMKILKKEVIMQRNQVEHTKAERTILQALQHPFLMGLRFAFQTKEKLYFVLDYFGGGELFFHLKNRRRFLEAEAKIHIAEIALALGHLHSLGIIYRDMKPENILLDDQGHVCLTDFGLSKDLEEGAKAHTFCGTPEYLAPEVVMGVGHGKEVDWWSLGILLYELTVGVPPFYSQNINEMYHKIQHGVLRFPPFLSVACKNFIISVLHRDPSKRLGCGDADIDTIKEHPFFKDIDWKKLYRKEIDPPYKPKMKDSLDTSNFEEEFTGEVPVDSFAGGQRMLQQKKEEAFRGWTFVDAQGHLVDEKDHDDIY